MSTYKANSSNSLDFVLTKDEVNSGELTYKKWYSFDAEIRMADGKSFPFESNGVWNSKIELKDEKTVLLEFRMGWNGIIIKTFFTDLEKVFLLQPGGTSTMRFSLIDNSKSEFLKIESTFKRETLNFDYNIETTKEFDNLPKNKFILLTILHCINYYWTTVV